MPVVLEYQTLAVIGFGNGKYPPEQISTLEAVLPSVWFGIISESVKESARREILIANTLPPHIIDKFVYAESIPTSIAMHHECVAISFTDIVGCNVRSKQL